MLYAYVGVIPGLGGLSSPSGFPEWVPWAALIAAAVSIGLHAATRFHDTRDRRRTFYGQAYMEPLRWVELIYRVHRRNEDQTAELVNHFHDVQERTEFYRGWLATESPALARSYVRFVKTVGDATRPLLRHAWRDDPVAPEDGLAHVEVPAAIEQAKEDFLVDVADHLSWSPRARVRFRRRNALGQQDDRRNGNG